MIGSFSFFRCFHVGGNGSAAKVGGGEIARISRIQSTMRKKFSSSSLLFLILLTNDRSGAVTTVHITAKMWAVSHMTSEGWIQGRCLGLSIAISKGICT